MVSIIITDCMFVEDNTFIEVRAFCVILVFDSYNKAVQIRIP